MITWLQGVSIATLMVVDIVLSCIHASRLPAQVPVHWNFRGEVDRYGSPWELAIVSPLLLVITIGIMVSLPLIGSLRESLSRSGAMYGRLILAATLMLVVFHLLTLKWSDSPSQIAMGAMVNVGALMAVMGNWTSKIRRNPVMGIRTPWTLKSDFVWERTHRVGARLMVAHGVIVILTSLLLPIWVAIATLFLGMIALAVWAWLYSRAVARLEQQELRQPAATP